MSYEIMINNKTICDQNWNFENEMMFTRIYYSISGEGYYDDKPFKKDCLYILPRNKSFHLHQNPLNPFEVIWTHVRFIPSLNTDIIEIEKFDDSLKNIVALLKMHIKSENVEFVRHIWHLLIQYLIETDIIKLEKLNEDILKVLKYIDMHIEDPRFINLEELAKVAHLDKSYLSRCFKKEIRMSPISYIRERKFQEAMIRLNRGEKVKYVSAQFGYEDSKSFSRAFKNVFGISPSKCQYLQP